MPEQIVAAQPDPVKQIMWNLTFHARFGNPLRVIAAGYACALTQERLS